MYAIHGSYFSNNFGDTLLVKLMCDYVSSVVGKENVFLAVSGNEKEQEAIGYPVIARDKCHLITHLIFAGGGYFGEPPKKGLRLLQWYIRNYKRHVAWNYKFRNAKVGAFGIGYGPLTLPFFRDVITRPLKKADVLFFRDQESVEYFKAYNALDKEVSLVTDFALSLEAVSRGKDNTIALHLPRLDIEAVHSILEAIDNSRYAGYKLEFISDGEGDFQNEYMDRIRNVADRNKIRSEITFKNYENMNELIERLASYLFVITTKLHVGIVTTAIGGKVISIPWHTKTSRFYNQIGLGRFCVRKENSNQEVGLLLDLLDAYVVDRKVIEESIGEMKKGIHEFIAN